MRARSQSALSTEDTLAIRRNFKSEENPLSTQETLSAVCRHLAQDLDQLICAASRGKTAAVLERLGALDVHLIEYRATREALTGQSPESGDVRDLISWLVAAAHNPAQPRGPTGPRSPRDPYR